MTQYHSCIITYYVLYILCVYSIYHGFILQKYAKLLKMTKVKPHV